MKAQDLKNNGYNVSPLIDDAVVSRVEAMVVASYIEPVVGTYDSTDGDQLAAAMSLVNLALLANTSHATRAGAKVKLSPQLSERGHVTQSDVDEADRLLRVLQSKDGAAQGRLDAIVDDVLHIYMRSYLSMN